MTTFTTRLSLLVLASLCSLGCGSDSEQEEEEMADASSTALPDAATVSEIDAAPSLSRVFVTSGQFSGDLGGVAGADAICQGAADSANLGGMWRAWLSSPSQSAIDHISDASPWYLPDRTTLIFSSHDQLRGNPSELIDWDENGSIHWTIMELGDRVVRTGTSAGQSDETCLGFTSNSDNVRGTYGFFDELSYWTSFGAGRCSAANGRLYCFEQ